MAPLFPTRFSVVVDACALYPYNVRDTLLRAAQLGLFRLHWTAEILDEMTRNLVANGVTTQEKATTLRTTMESAFDESMVTGYERYVASMQNDEGDRHVAAAALVAGAQVIVTFNLRDFRNLPDGIEAQSPDDFLGYLFDLDRDAFVEMLGHQAADRTRPPTTLHEMLAAMEGQVPDLVRAVRAHLAAGVPEPAY